MDFKKLLDNKFFKGTAVITAAVFFILVLYLWNPDINHYYPPCLFQSVTGLLCPGCGGMRGTHHLLHLHFLEAFKYNPLVFISTPLILYSFIYYLVLLMFNKQLPAIPINVKVITIVGILTGLFWVFRNL